MIPTTPTHRLILLRHGESVGNAANIYQGQTEYVLTDRGIQQAARLAQHWQARAVHFNRIISSPQQRARQTAEIIADALNIPIEFKDEWMERDFGRLSGLTQTEANLKYPRPTFVDLYDPIGQTGESQWQLYLRAGQALQDVLRRPAGSYLVVAHGGILNMTLHAILGLTPAPNFQGPVFRLGNTGYADLSYDSTKHIWRVESLNDQRHLDT